MYFIFRGKEKINKGKEEWKGGVRWYPSGWNEI
jgi:hypothetical protein